MSIGLYVGLNSPLEASQLKEEIINTFFQLTRFDIEQQIEVLQLDEGKYSNVTQLQLVNSSSPALEVRAETLGKVQIYIFTDDDESPLISIDPEGEQRGYTAKVLAAVCAIAIARQHKSEIQNNQGFWGANIAYSAEELFDLLKCRYSHKTLEGAVSEVLTNIESAR